MLIPLPATFETYMAGLSRNRRSKHRRSKRMLEDELGFTTRVLTGPEAAAFFDTFVDLHNAQFKAKNKLGHFDDWPGSRDFYARLARALAGTDRVRFYIQEDAEGRVRAALMCFVSGPVCHAHLTARVEDADNASAGLGLYAQFERIERLIGEGVQMIESGGGNYDYKRSLNGRTVPLLRVLVGGASAPARLRLALLTGWADALNLVYYRAWFNKVAPRLRRHGLAQNPLWGPWIRSRL